MYAGSVHTVTSDALRCFDDEPAVVCYPLSVPLTALISPSESDEDSK